MLFVCAGFIAYDLPGRFGVLAFVAMVFFTLPGLMSGAHWLGDELMGALGIGIAFLAWVLATPLHSIIVSRLCALWRN